MYLDDLNLIKNQSLCSRAKALPLVAVFLDSQASVGGTSPLCSGESYTTLELSAVQTWTQYIEI